MNSINTENRCPIGIEEETNYQNYSSKLQNLPRELILHIFSYLCNMDLSHTVPLNSLFQDITLETAKQNAFLLIKNTAKSFAENLPDSLVDQKQKLLNLCESREIFNGVNLLDIRASLHGLKESFINILKDLELEDLDKLELSTKNYYMPDFLKNVFELSKIYKRIDAAKCILKKKEKARVLLKISKKLTEIGHIDKAKEVAYTIPKKEHKSLALVDISK